MSRRRVRALTPSREASSAPAQNRRACNNASARSDRATVSVLMVPPRAWKDHPARKSGQDPTYWPSNVPAMSTRAIDARGLSRTFASRTGEVDAVRGLDLRVEEGALVAFLGPNGAGKSTSMRLLTTLLEPTGGTATVCGHDIRTAPAAVRRSIGHVGQGTSAGHHQRVRDELVMQARFYGVPRRTAAVRTERLLADFALEGCAGRTVSTLSGGQRRRLDVAMGMVHGPRLLFLDEPSTGL